MLLRFGTGSGFHHVIGLAIVGLLIPDVLTKSATTVRTGEDTLVPLRASTVLCYIPFQDRGLPCGQSHLPFSISAVSFLVSKPFRYRQVVKELSSVQVSPYEIGQQSACYGQNAHAALGSVSEMLVSGRHARVTPV